MPARALIILGFALWACLARPAAAEETPATPEPEPGLAVEGMTFVASTGSQNDAIVEAGHATVGRADRVALLSDVHARIGKAAGAQTIEGGLEIECDRGRFDIQTGDLTAEGNVRGVTADGRRFEAPRLLYRHATGRVSTQAPVTIRDAFGTIRGSGFEYWVRENRFRLIGGATVEQGQ